MAHAATSWTINRLSRLRPSGLRCPGPCRSSAADADTLASGEAAAREPHPEYADADEGGGYWSRTHDVEVDVTARTKRRYTAIGSCSGRPTRTRMRSTISRNRATRSGGRRCEGLRLRPWFQQALVERAEREGVTMVGIDELLA